MEVSVKKLRPASISSSGMFAARIVLRIHGVGVPERGQYPSRGELFLRGIGSYGRLGNLDAGTAGDGYVRALSDWRIRAAPAGGHLEKSDN